TLYAREDTHYVYNLLRFFKTDRIFNVRESLVDVYPQLGPRVNTNAEGAWEASQAVYADFAAEYGPLAAQVFLARSKLGYLKYQHAALSEMTQLAWKLWRLRGRKELRFIVNSLLFKIPLARPFLVS